jgi:C-terminal peptidase prc
MIFRKSFGDAQVGIMKIWILSVIVPFLLPLSVVAESPARVESEDDAVQQIRCVIDTVTNHHINPPDEATLMKVVLSAFADTTAAARQDTATDVIAEPHRLERRGEFEQQLMKLTASIEDRTQVMNRALQAIAKIVPAGLQLITAEEHRVGQQIAANRYVGIGIQLAADEQKQRPVIPTVFADGPADEAGARNHDIIISVDGRDTQGIGLVDVVQWLRGPAGTSVEVTLQQPDSDQLRTYTMVRGVVPFASIEKPMLTEDQSTAGIAISRIAASTVHELRKVEPQLPQSVELVVLDLRDTDAGELHYVELLASHLIDGGSIGHVTTRQRDYEISAEPGRLFRDKQVVLLVRPSSMRMIWWLAAAIADTGSGQCITEYPLSIERELPPLYLMESVPLADRPGAIASDSSDSSVYVRLATGRLSRANGQGLQSVLKTFGSLKLQGSEAAASEAARIPPDQVTHLSRDSPLGDLLPLVSKAATAGFQNPRQPRS